MEPTAYTLRHPVILALLAASAAACAGELSWGPSADAGRDTTSESLVIAPCGRATEILAACAACHSPTAAATIGGGFDMQTAGWEARLLGTSTPADGPATSLCKGRNLPFLEENVLPARGLFLDKLKLAAPPCGAQMPKSLPKLDAADLACVQSWADGLVAAGRQP